MTIDPLSRIRRVARKAALARLALEHEIREAYPAVSLRKIAEAAELSHEQVRRIVSRG